MDIFPPPEGTQRESKPRNEFATDILQLVLTLTSQTQNQCSGVLRGILRPNAYPEIFIERVNPAQLTLLKILQNAAIRDPSNKIHELMRRIEVRDAATPDPVDQS